MTHSRCRVCTSGRAATIEDAVLSGGQVRVLARRNELSESSIRRHMSAHVEPELQRAARKRVELRAGTILDRLASMADDAADIRDRALSRNATRTAVAALDSERAVLAVIVDRLGIDDLSILQDLETARNVFRMIGRIARKSPEMGDAIAAGLAELGEQESADIVYELARKPRQIEGNSGQ